MITRSLEMNLPKLLPFNIGYYEMKRALQRAWEEMYQYKLDIRLEGEKTVKYLKKII